MGGRRVLKGFGSNAEGAMIRVSNSELLLFSHSNDINGTANRWNMTVWASWDSAATWEPALQAEPDGDLPGSAVPCAAHDLLPSVSVLLACVVAAGLRFGFRLLLHRRLHDEELSTAQVHHAAHGV